MKRELTIRELKPEDIKDEHGYVEWLNDPEVNRYLECRHVKHTVESTRKYVEDMYNSENNYLFGVFLGDEHIGNVKIGDVDRFYRRAHLGTLISKKHWSRGIGAIALTQDFAFGELKLHKLYGGIYVTHEASIAVMKYVGWEIVGEYKDHCIDVDGNYVNCYIVEMMNPNEV